MGKHSDGSASTREAKLVVIWTAEQFDQDSLPVCDAGSVTYSAAIDSAATRDTDAAPAAFTERLRREAERRGFPDAAHQVVLGDGAKWILGRGHGDVSRRDSDRGLLPRLGEAVGSRPDPHSRRPETAPRREPRRAAKVLRAGAQDAVQATLPAHVGHCEKAAKAICTTSPPTVRACATPSSAPKACRSAPAWSRGAARRSWVASLSPACTGPKTGPTESSPARLHLRRTLREVLHLANGVTHLGGRVTANRMLASTEPPLHLGRTNCPHRDEDSLPDAGLHRHPQDHHKSQCVQLTDPLRTHRNPRNQDDS